MSNNGVTNFIEIGSGKVLSGMEKEQLNMQNAFLLIQMILKI